MNLIERDKLRIWHPFTQSKTADDPIAIHHAKGSYVFDENGKQYLDLVSSWWVNLHGHAHPEIAKSIYDQALTLEHIIFAGFTHEPAVNLCEKLSTALPDSLTRFFFSDNGSTSVETALKMAYQYWQNINENRAIFLSFEGGYHGDTFGAMSVGAKSGFHDPFQDLFFNVLSIPYPSAWEEDDAVDEKEAKALDVLRAHLKDYGTKIAAFILEPLVQGSSGMRMCRASFIQQVVSLVRSYGILIIFDEVMTGFGRTGTTFALDQIDVTPDFLCLSKGITGGFLPLALTVTTEKIYNAFLHNEWKYAFAHGHSYTANPLACAAALTSFEILQRPSTQKSIQMIEHEHQKGCNSLKTQNAAIKNSRIQGTIAAFEITGDAQKVKKQCLSKGLLIRPLGNTLYLLPPYSITSEELQSVYTSLIEVLT